MIYKIYAGKYEYFKPSSLEEVEFDLKKLSSSSNTTC